MLFSRKAIGSCVVLLFRLRLAYSTKLALKINLIGEAISQVLLLRSLLETQKTYQPAIVEDSKVCAPLWKATLEARKSAKSENVDLILC